MTHEIIIDDKSALDVHYYYVPATDGDDITPATSEMVNITRINLCYNGKVRNVTKAITGRDFTMIENIIYNELR